MSWIIKQLTGSLGQYIIVALGVVLLGLLITTQVLWSSNTKLHEDLATERSTVQTLQSANQSNQTSISTLKAANKAWSDLFESQKTKDQQAAESQQRFREQLEADNRRKLDAVLKERQEPDCAAIMAIDIQRACPAAVGRMRSDASGSTHGDR